MDHPKPALLGVSLKMYFGHEETLEWCRQVAVMAKGHQALQDGEVELFILPSFQALVPARQILADTPVAIGAQDLHWEDRGAFTGEVSGPALAEADCRYVEVGHAERRRLFGEDDAVVSAKTAAALRNGLIPVICVGEPDEGPAENAAEVCLAQLSSALQPDQRNGRGSAVVVAYEPAWAIGSTSPASSKHISEVCARLKEWLRTQTRFTQWSVIYGGSAGPGLLTQLDSDVDGLFLGRFAHRVTALSDIIDEASRLRDGYVRRDG
ncbi:triose-phosphate isomerase family protein [Arthrobacter sp. FW306-07-I]|uniref:triose-phosphate isomerase family protein n=1 Tax=Arthrobacter sp. FW306-07-I TaxID=2879622 RepID=UPI001F3C0728|nr:triose-phosphate isomerase family protein [Arthrobacter sp. FW306-07-I]UKA77616.1 triose-phosphate isomerase [Arthrobacter sp. FW306-07-I]